MTTQERRRNRAPIIVGLLLILFLIWGIWAWADWGNPGSPVADKDAVMPDPQTAPIATSGNRKAKPGNSGRDATGDASRGARSFEPTTTGAPAPARP